MIYSFLLHQSKKAINNLIQFIYRNLLTFRAGLPLFWNFWKTGNVGEFG